MSANDTALRTAVLVVVLLFAVHLVGVVLMMPMMAGGGWGIHSTWHGTASGWAWLPMLVVPLLVFAGLGYLGYRVLEQDDEAKQPTALDELRTAYARGELTDEQFEHRRERLPQDESQ